eukprot:1968325-Rhodomonas_salina.2
MARPSGCEEDWRFDSRLGVECLSGVAKSSCDAKEWSQSDPEAQNDASCSSAGVVGIECGRYDAAATSGVASFVEDGSSRFSESNGGLEGVIEMGEESAQGHGVGGKSDGDAGSVGCTDTMERNGAG